VEDRNLSAASAQIRAARVAAGSKPVVKGFFDASTFTATHVAYDPATRHGVIVDSVLDYDPASGRTSTDSADHVIDFVTREALTIDWLLETGRALSSGKGRRQNCDRRGDRNRATGLRRDFQFRR